MIDFDNRFRKIGDELICGIDEAGRGPLAGPVVASAVIFAPGVQIKDVKDSKKLSAQARERLALEIKEKSLGYRIHSIDVTAIDELNIFQSSLLAMKMCAETITPDPAVILVDGNRVFESSKDVRAIVKGDARSFSIAAASILAKVERDRIMATLAEQFPQYHWEKNKGYPTRDHIRELLFYGPSPFHRKTFLKNLPVWRESEYYR